MKKLIILVIICSSFKSTEASTCKGRFINPITDICWSCIFPLTIGPVQINLGPGKEDTPNPSSPICFCEVAGKVPIPGISVGFWEPVRLVDITRVPYCMINLGGVSLGGGIEGHGGAAKRGNTKSGLRQSFYHVHWYIYPLIYWLELLLDFVCLENMNFDVAYMSEFDPLWNDDESTAVIEPEALLFGNPIAQAACAIDCATASTGLSLNALFWCGGCQGSLYPMTGHVSAHVGGVQASMLITQRMTAKLHRLGLLKGTFGDEAKCQKYYMPLIKKGQYKMQMTYPIPEASGPLACHPYGRTEVMLASGKEYPGAEDFGYLIWRKRNCCAF